MANNPLMPGAAGLPAPRPKDSLANPPLALPAPGPSPMQQDFLSVEDQAALRFGKVQDAFDKVTATRRELDKLLAFGDTVSMDDVVEAASGMVAAGLPAAEVAATLATIPEAPGQLQAWVQDMSEKLKPQEEQVGVALAAAGYQLGLASFANILANSAEDFFQRQKLAAAKPTGRLN